MSDDEINESEIFDYPPESMDAAANHDAVEPWKPTAAQRVAVAELAYRRENRDEQFATSFVGFLHDCQATGWPLMMVAVLDLLEDALIENLGRTAAVAWLDAALAKARDAA